MLKCPKAPGCFVLLRFMPLILVLQICIEPMGLWTALAQHLDLRQVTSSSLAYACMTNHSPTHHPSSLCPDIPSSCILTAFPQPSQPALVELNQSNLLASMACDGTGRPTQLPAPALSVMDMFYVTFATTLGQHKELTSAQVDALDCTLSFSATTLCQCLLREYIVHYK